MISFIDCELQNLQNFPVIPSLLRLDLVHNGLKGEDLKQLKTSRHIQTLYLSHNKIENIKDLQQLAFMKELTILDLFGNPLEDKCSGEQLRK